MKKILFLFCFILSVIAAGCARSPNPHLNTPISIPIQSIQSSGSFINQSLGMAKVTMLEKELDTIMTATGARGISASVGIPGDGIWSAARGVTGNPSQEEITTDLPFYAGSIGKIFTAVIILKLSEEGRLDLETTVAKWFPEITWASQVTVNHLLTHTSGIASFDDRKEYEANKSLYRNPEALLSYIAKKELLFEPGKHYAYSNTGYLMLGLIIERVTGKSYKETVEKYIINKVSLPNTVVITSETIGDLIVRGHHHGSVLSEPDDYVVPFAAGSIAATPEDLIIFLQALMSGRILSHDSLQIMFSDMNLMTANQNTYYGKGIVAALKTPAGDIIGHTGGIKGFGASLFYHPERNIFVCVMMNDDIKAVDPAMFKLLETLIEL